VRRLALLALVSSMIPACTIRVAGSVSKPTALERQLLGDYDELDKELLLASSIRGELQPAAGTYEAIKAEALEQRAVQRFNEDDLAELKRERCIAETLEATIVARPCPLTDKDSSASRRIVRVVGEENRARKAILTWAAHELARGQGRSLPDPSELTEVRKTYQRLLVEAAKPGELHEVSPGVFREANR
jgi:hypothetical protein